MGAGGRSTSGVVSAVPDPGVVIDPGVVTVPPVSDVADPGERRSDDLATMSGDGAGGRVMDVGGDWSAVPEDDACGSGGGTGSSDDPNGGEGGTGGKEAGHVPSGARRQRER